MTLYVLDTDHVSLFQRRHPAVVRQIGSRRPTEIAVTLISAEEQLRGWLSAIRRAGTTESLIPAYSGLRRVLEYFRSIQTLDFEARAFDVYQGLRRQKIRIGTQDLRIAAVTLSVKGTLVTRNLRDFARIPGLAIENWAAER